MASDSAKEQGDGAVVSDAVQAFHTIYRLAVMCSESIAPTDPDGGALLLAIKDIAEKHGRALDDHPDSTRLGVFDKTGDESEAPKWQ